MIWTKFLAFIFIPPIAAMLTVCAVKHKPVTRKPAKHGSVVTSQRLKDTDPPYDSNDLPPPEAVPTPKPQKTPVPLPHGFDEKPRI